MDILVWAFAILLIIGVLGFTALITVSNLLYICQPSEVLIFSGRRGSDAQPYRAVKGGRALRIPLIEVVDRLDLTNMIIDVSVTGAYSSGGIPLNVQGVANVKIAGHEPVLGNAVERLLGVPREGIVVMAKEVLEGNLRGVLARLTPEEVNEDKIAFAEKLLDEAEPDLARLGLVLDTMKIQNVADDRGYLDSIGRKRSADIIKRSRIAEANARAESAIKDAANRERARLKDIEAQDKIKHAENARRVADAQTRAAALVAEAEGRVNVEVARALAAVDAETERVEQVRKTLEADVIEPARAGRDAAVSDARGQASRITEQGRATVHALEAMIASWKASGDNAKEVVLMQRFQSVLDALVTTLDDVHVDRVVMLPESGKGTAAQAATLVEELKASVGIDVPALLERVAGKAPSKS